MSKVKKLLNKFNEATLNQQAGSIEFDSVDTYFKLNGHVDYKTKKGMVSIGNSKYMHDSMTITDADSDEKFYSYIREELLYLIKKEADLFDKKLLKLLNTEGFRKV